MNKEYTEEQLEEAKQYLRDRLEAEISMEHDVDVVLEMYMPILVGLLMNGATREDLDDIVNEIVDRLLNDCYILGVDERTEREKEIIAYMNLKREGMTLSERFEQRCDTFINELVAAVVAGGVLGLSEQSIISSVRNSYDNPYENEIIIDAKKKIERGESSVDIEVLEEPHYGRGRDLSSMKAMKMMGAYAVADAWMWDLFEMNRDAKGYFVFRGSGFPCQVCDEAVISGYHPITDTSHLVPLHPHCKCYVVFV